MPLSWGQTNKKPWLKGYLNPPKELRFGKMGGEGVFKPAQMSK